MNSIYRTIHKWRPWKVFDFQPPPVSIYATSNIFPVPWPWTPNFKWPPASLNPSAINLSNKLWNNNRTMHVNERNQNKSKTKSRHIQIDHAFYCSIYPINNAMVSLKDGLTIWHQSQKEDFLPIIYWCLTQHQSWSWDMMPGHGTNPIFFNKNITIGCSEHSLTRQPLHQLTSHFCLCIFRFFITGNQQLLLYQEIQI